jgi:eukaryotic-like serine/threonine-protein kinase
MSTCPRCQTDHGASGKKCPVEVAALPSGAGPARTLPEDEGVPDPLIHAKVGPWTILERIGGGGMGTVYLAKNLEIDVQVAVKVMNVDAIIQSSRADTLEENVKLARERFLREAKIAAELGKNDPGIVQILAFGHLPDDRPYMVMEYLYGRGLDKWLEQGPPPTLDLRRWLAQLCDALASIHEAGVIHRDLKPENIWIAEPKTGPSLVKLIDFGISKAKGNAVLTKAGEIAGSPGYMSPERIVGESGDLRSDVYAVGVLLYEIVSGRLPFSADSLVTLALKITRDPPPPLCPRPGFVCSFKLEALIGDCLAKVPDQRPQSAAELRLRLLEALDGTSLAGSIQPGVERRHPDQVPETVVRIAALRASRLRLIAAAIGLLVMGGGYALWNRGDRGSADLTTIPARPPPPRAPTPPEKARPTSAVSAAPVEDFPAMNAHRDRGSHVGARVHRGSPSSSGPRAVGRTGAHGDGPPSALQPQSQDTASHLQPAAPPVATPGLPARAVEPSSITPGPATETPLDRSRPEWIPHRARTPSPSERDLITDEKTLIGR